MHDCVGVKVPDMIFNAHLLCAASLLSLQQQTFFFSKWCFKCFSSAVAPVKHVRRGTPRGGAGTLPWEIWRFVWRETGCVNKWKTEEDLQLPGAVRRWDSPTFQGCAGLTPEEQTEGPTGGPWVLEDARHIFKPQNYVLNSMKVEDF